MTQKNETMQEKLNNRLLCVGEILVNTICIGGLGLSEEELKVYLKEVSKLFKLLSDDYSKGLKKIKTTQKPTNMLK